MTFRRKLGWTLVLTVFVVLVFGTATLGYALLQPMAHDEPERIVVPEGSSFTNVLLRLEGKGMLGEGIRARTRRLAARVYARISPVADRMQVGEYRLDPGLSLLDFMDKLERGDVIMRRVTLVEGWNIRDIRRALKNAEGLVHRIDELDNQALMKKLGKPDQHPEGWFAPDTYAYVRGDTDLELLARALEHQQRILSQAWKNRAEELPLDSAYEALILASIVEKETAVPDEREEIAGVFVNRLNQGMRLQTDPTVIYGLGDDYQGNIRSHHLQQDTPYNTYRRAGLPPTPIAMPGEASIRAAVNPADTEALYFVARGDGTHVFSQTLEEHQQAVREYQLRRRKDYRSTPKKTSSSPGEPDES